MTDPLFYDSLAAGDRAGPRFGIASRPLPSGWQQAATGEWLVNLPPGSAIPAQGWKIHVSACQRNADQVLARVWEYCVPRLISFKYLRGPLALLMRNAKYAPRGGSGKLVTIYPVDDGQCERILSELGKILDGEPGPYILSDLRYGDGPLHVRYGAFKERFCRDGSGDHVPAMEDPQGQLVPDPRTPVFTPPPWVSLPDFLVPHLAARNAVKIADLPYQIERALHFSNGGGVYAGMDKRTGERVVLKEARPHAGLSADGADAVSRLRRERDVLERLAGLPFVPGVRGYFECGGHDFLVQEFIDGTALNSCYADRYPLLGPDADAAAIAGYRQWALRVCEGVDAAVAAIHERGVIINDLHMFNIIVRPDDSVVLIDFEAAAYADEDRRLTIGNPGFVAPRDRAGFGIDRYSLACVRLAMFMPLTMLFPLDPGKAVHLASVIGEHFGVPAGFLDQAVAEITGTPAQAVAEITGTPAQAGAANTGTGQPKARGSRTGAWPAVGEPEPSFQTLTGALVRGIVASATPQRGDRLFPGDIEQFAAPGAGLGLAYGAAGVLYALAQAGVRTAEHEEWLLARVAQPPRGIRLGLYDGLLGVGFVLETLGYRAAALRTAEVFLAEKWQRIGTGLHSGLAGAALVLLHFGGVSADNELRGTGMRVADIVADRLGTGKLSGQPRGQAASQQPGRPPSGRTPAGLLRGASGAGLLFIRLYEQTRDSGFLDLAESALAADLDRCVTDRRGALQVDDGWRVLPYLDGGSAGIGLVLDEFLAHRDNERFSQAASAIRAAACSGFYAQSGLLQGRAGMLFYLARQRALRKHPDAGRHADRHVRRLAWHAVRYADGLAFPGDQLFRLSMDLGTGSAGVLLALAAALSPQGAALPFLAVPGRTTAAGAPALTADPQAPSQLNHASWAGNKIPLPVKEVTTT